MVGSAMYRVVARTRQSPAAALYHRLLTELPRHGGSRLASHHPCRRQLSGSQSSSTTTITSAIFSNVLLDASKSAACVRTQSILEGLKRLKHNNENRNPVYYATSAKVENIASNETSSTGKQQHTDYQVLHMPPNDSRRLEQAFGIGDNADAVSSCLDLIVFDRFFAEEQFSFPFYNHDIPLVLDMQDMHSLRWGRQDIVQKYDRKNISKDPLACLHAVLDYHPPATDERLVRELASIHRCDLTLVCSPFEMYLLQSFYGISAEKLRLASFFVKKQERDVTTNKESFSTPLPIRRDESTSTSAVRFVFCGGFRHAPNVDAVQVLLDYIWPRLQSQLPESSLHIYGAFCPIDKLQQSQHANRNVFIHGYEPRLEQIFGGNHSSDCKILLAPLRFGAGIKGKIVDAWTFGMPVVTTPIGSEGMTYNNQGTAVFGGSIASTLGDFCHAAVILATDASEYRRAQVDGQTVLQQLYNAKNNWAEVEARLVPLLDADKLADRRKHDYNRAILWHNRNRSTEYFSRWVELKNKIRDETGESK